MEASDVDLADAVIRHVAAVDGREPRCKLAVAMLVGQETARLSEVYYHAMGLLYEGEASEREREAARIAIEMLAITLFARVEALDDHFEQKLDEEAEAELAEAELNPPAYDRERGLDVFLEPDHRDEGDMRDLALDLQAVPGQVYLAMRVVEEGGDRLAGWLSVEDVPMLRRYLDIVAADAEAMLLEEEVAR